MYVCARVRICVLVNHEYLLETDRNLNRNRLYDNENVTLTILKKQIC